MGCKGGNLSSTPLQAMELFDALHALLGIRFMYEEEGREQRHETREMAMEAPDFGGFAELSDELLARVEWAFLTSDMQRISELIDELRLYNAGLADTLEGLMHNFQYSTVLDALKDYRSGDDTNHITSPA